MRCEVCGNHDVGCFKNKRGAKHFVINLRSNFKQYSNIPCHAKKLFKYSSFLPVKTPDDEIYEFAVVRENNKTRIRGGEYEMFLEAYDMSRNDKMEFEIIQNEEQLSITPMTSDGYILARVPESDSESEYEDEDEEQYGFEAHARAVVLPFGMKLSTHQVNNINTFVQQRGIGLGCIFVHRMTETDILRNGLRIPKHIAKALHICRSAIALLEMDVVTEAEYSTAPDGRIRFKTGWWEFRQDNNIQIHDLVLVMFHLVDDVLHISFDFI